MSYSQCILLPTFVTLLSLVAVADEKKPHWSYDGKTGPEHWGDLHPDYKLAKTGKRQSPIDFAGEYSQGESTIEFDYAGVPLRIINNGHTVQVNYAAGSSIRIGKRTFELQQFHFHTPSEHTVDGEHYAMELHLVHQEVTKDTKPGQLAVVGVFLKTGKENKTLQSVWKHMPSEHGQSAAPSGVGVNASNLLPAKRIMLTYSGSLTTPPCSEDVLWNVFAQPIEISKAQAAAFAKLFPHNNRPIQPLNDRTVGRSK